MFCLAQTLPDSIQVDTLLMDDGTLYIGQIRDSLFNGQGTYVYLDGTIYEGTWKDGLWDGQGTLRYPDGDVYTGQFKQHVKEGHGTYMYSDGAKYEGDWSNDMFNGKGRLVFADGGLSEGAWKDDMKHGSGPLITQDRDVDIGYFYNDEFLGMPFNVEIDAEAPLTDELKEWGFKQEAVYEIPQLTFALSYSINGMAALSVWMDYSEDVFWGITVGRAIETPSQGKFSSMAWSSCPNDVHMEGEFISSIYTVDAGFRLDRISIGGAVGVGYRKAYKNCRVNSKSDFYKEYELKYGEQYHKELTIGAATVFRAFLRYTILIKNRPKAYTYLGYGNSEGMFLGLGISF